MARVHQILIGLCADPIVLVNGKEYGRRDTVRRPAGLKMSLSPLSEEVQRLNWYCSDYRTDFPAEDNLTAAFAGDAAPAWAYRDVLDSGRTTQKCANNADIDRNLHGFP